MHLRKIILLILMILILFTSALTLAEGDYPIIGKPQHNLAIWLFGKSPPNTITLVDY